MNKYFAFFFVFAVILLLAALAVCCVNAFRWPRLAVGSISNCQLSHRSVKAERHTQTHTRHRACILLQQACIDLLVRRCWVIQSEEKKWTKFLLNTFPSFTFQGDLYLCYGHSRIFFFSSEFPTQTGNEIKNKETLENARTKKIRWERKRFFFI